MDGEDCSSSSFSSTSRASLDQPDCLHNSSRSPSTSGSGENLIVLCHGDSSSSDSPSSYQNAEWTTHKRFLFLIPNLHSNWLITKLWMKCIGKSQVFPHIPVAFLIKFFYTMTVDVFADVRSSKLKIFLHIFLVQLFQTLTTRSFFIEFIHSVIVFLNTFPIYFVRYRNEIV